MAMTGGTAKLVKTGYGDYGDKNFPIKLYVYYKTSQDPATNESTITCGMYVTTPDNWDIGPWQKSSDSYVGTKSLTFNGAIPNFDGTYWIAENKTFTVSHDDDGKGKATIYWKWGVNSPWGQMQNPSDSFEITLPTIARASTVSCPTSGKMKSNVTIGIGRKSTTAFKHTLKYTFGGTTGTIATGVNEATYTWPVPDLAAKCNDATSGKCIITCETYSGNTKIGTATAEMTLNVPAATEPSVWDIKTGSRLSSIAMGSTVRIHVSHRASTNFTHKLSYSFGSVSNDFGSGITSYYDWPVSLDLAKQIRNETSGTCTITCVTYNGTEEVGTKILGIPITVPNNSATQPSITAFNLTPSGSVPSEFSGLYIQGKTGVQASFTATSTYSTVSSYQMTVDSKTYSGKYATSGSGNYATSGAFASSGSKTVKGTVTDARGYSSSLEKTITVIPYSKPKVVPYGSERKIICRRGEGADARMLYIKAGRSYSPVVANGTQKNSCSLVYQYKTSSATSYSDRINLIGENDSNDFVEILIEDIDLDTTLSYDVRILAIDTMGEESTPYTFRIPTEDITFHLKKGGKGASFGKYSEIENGVEFEWDVYGRAYGLGKLYDIPANSDLNDEKYRVFGCYGITKYETAKTISNIPYQRAGVLRVYSAIGDGLTAADVGWVHIAQVYEPYEGQGLFRRLLHRDGTDAEWKIEPWVAVCGTDSVESSGTITTSAGITWHYKKWFNGTAECWARRNVTVDTTGQWGSLYSGGISSTPLPFTFLEPPVCTVTVEKGTTDHFFFVGSNGQATTAATPSILVFRPASSTGVNVNVLYSVHGKWK